MEFADDFNLTAFSATKLGLISVFVADARSCCSEMRQGLPERSIMLTRWFTIGTERRFTEAEEVLVELISLCTNAVCLSTSDALPSMRLGWTKD